MNNEWVLHANGVSESEGGKGVLSASATGAEFSPSLGGRNWPPMYVCLVREEARRRRRRKRMRQSLKFE